MSVTAIDRRINTKEKAKVVTAVWGTKLIQFLAALAILHPDDLKKKDEFIQDDLKKRMN